MLSLSALSSTELSGLKETLKTDHAKLEFLEAVDRFLKTHPLDGGAETDTVYVVGRLLTSEDIWAEIPAVLFSAKLSHVDVASLNVFLRSAPDYLLEVKKLITQFGDERKEFFHFGNLVVGNVLDERFLTDVEQMVLGHQFPGLPSPKGGGGGLKYAVPKVVAPRTVVSGGATYRFVDKHGMFVDVPMGPRVEFQPEPPHYSGGRSKPKPHPVKHK
jgi:hypothetical protein